ncbi:MAG: fasciclin domain-containing protein [Candidatus Kapabacteria bacterium]|nr:fasciclin domain-containing protein [Candidatus Kapabacteria bacterium]
MKTLIQTILIGAIVGVCSCGDTDTQNEAQSQSGIPEQRGQSGVQDPQSKPNVVQVAVGSKDHTTLVTAVKAAELVDALSNAGPFTVFAPVNAAFDKLPTGTVEDLLKPEKKEALAEILQYHVYVGNLSDALLMDGQQYNMVAGGNISISEKEGKKFVNGTAQIIASVPASNGIIYVIDGVLLPPKK